MSSPEFFRTIDFCPSIDPEACVLCLDCVRACPLHVIEVAYPKMQQHPVLQVKQHVCRNCRACVKTCSRGAIQISVKLGGAHAGHLDKELFS